MTASLLHSVVPPRWRPGRDASLDDRLAFAAGATELGLGAVLLAPWLGRLTAGLISGDPSLLALSAAGVAGFVLAFGGAVRLVHALVHDQSQAFPAVAPLPLAAKARFLRRELGPAEPLNSVRQRAGRPAAGPKDSS